MLQTSNAYPTILFYVICSNPMGFTFMAYCLFYTCDISLLAITVLRFCDWTSLYSMVVFINCFLLTRQAVNTRWWEIAIHSCYSLVKIAFVTIWVSKNNRWIWHHNARTLPSCNITEGDVTMLLLTLKWLGHFFQNVISFSDAVHPMCNIFIWNWSNTVNV